MKEVKAIIQPFMLDKVVGALVDIVVDTIQKAAHTGNTGEGKIWVYDIRETVRIRTGERGRLAL